ncbi:MAG: SPOR domain-containing protein [Deltaproteobacteria bacterium]|nr:SPOR domain-containing protein [Deltaproteobacteria bacterium]
MPHYPRQRGKRFRFEFSGTFAFFGSLICLSLLAWIFFLGILAGRGFFSEGLDTLAERVFPVVKRPIEADKNSAPSNPVKRLDKVPNFQFYKGLSDTEEAKKDLPGVKGRETAAGPEKPVRPARSPGAYTVQLASLGSEAQALKMVNPLVLKGYEAFYYKIIIQGKPYFRVMCGRFKSRKEADDLQRLLARQENMGKGFVTMVEKD